MQEIDKKVRDHYFRIRYRITNLHPSGDEFRWFCHYVVQEEWWNEYVLSVIEQKTNGNTVLTSEVVKWFLDAESFVDSVYIFLIKRDGIETATEEKEESEKITYGKVPKECPIDPEARKRCPECAERVW